MAIDFGDLASRYANARIDSATQAFTDPEAYLNNRLQQNFGVDMNGNTKPVSTTISYGDNGQPATVTTKHEVGETPQIAPQASMSNLNFAPPQVGGLGLQMPQQAPAGQQPMFNVGAPQEVTAQPTTPQQIQQEAQLPQQLAQQAEVAKAATQLEPQAQVQMQPQVQTAPQVQLPQPGPGVQLAGPMVPGAVANVPSTTPQPNQAPETVAPVWHGQLANNANNFTGLTELIAQPNTPADVKDEAKDRLRNLLLDEQLKAKAEKTITAAGTGDKRAVNDLAREMTSNKAEGSYLKAILFSRLGLTQLAADEQAKLGGGNKYSSYMDAEGNHYTVKLGGNGAVEKAFDQNGTAVDQDKLAYLNANYLSMKGAATGQTMGYDKSGNVISHTVVPGTGRVIWKDETNGKILTAAPEGYHTGKNQQEMLANTAFAQTRKKLSDANSKAIASGLRPPYTDDQIEQQASAARASILGLPSTTYGGGGEGGVNPPAPAAGGLSSGIQSKIISGARSTPEQQALYQQSVDAGTPGRLPNGNPVARPGTSLHETGNALDIDAKKLTSTERRELAQNGWFQPLPNDPNHWERVTPTETTKAPVMGATNPSITDVQRSNAQAIANYEQPPLKGGGTNSQNAIIMSMVREMNPGYDVSKYDTMAKARTQFTTGKQGDTVRSMNVAIDHLDTLGEAGRALQNGNIPLFNKIGNEYARNTGSAPITNFDGIKTLVGAEVAKAIAGGATALGDREEVRREINAANSPQQLAGVIQKYQQLLGGQLKGLRTQYEETGLKDFDKKLNPRTKKVLGGDENTNTRSNW